MSHYIRKSLELHLFFGRIMKEHALFLQAGFTPAAPAFSERADSYRKEFETLLEHAVKLSDGIAGKKVLHSGEVVTEFTALAEEQTRCLTGIPINGDITEQTKCLRAGEYRGSSPQIQGAVRRLNRTALNLLSGLIEFKEEILECVQQGALFTVNYPLLIEHILREARLYRKYVDILEREGDLPDRVVKNDECFWNRIMMEHAHFIRGLLDPCETELIGSAEAFADGYSRLLEESRSASDKVGTANALAQTIRFRDFKAAGTQGIQQNEIRSVILPLLADHVLREANHYIRLLEGGENQSGMRRK